MQQRLHSLLGGFQPGNFQLVVLDLSVDIFLNSRIVQLGNAPERLLTSRIIRVHDQNAATALTSAWIETLSRLSME